MAKTNRVLGEPVRLGRPKINDDLLVIQGKPDRYNVISSPAIGSTMQVFGAQGDLKAMAARSNRHPTMHGKTIKYGEKDNWRKVSFSRGDNICTLEIDDITKLSGYNKSIKKIFAFALVKTNEQAYSDGVFRQNYITFPLKELLEVGVYKNIRAARAGYEDAMRALTSLKFSGKISQGKKAAATQAKIEVLFTGAEISNGECKIYLNERINWQYVAPFYTMIPAFYFALPTKAADLLFYVFYLARQNQEKIRDNGYFNINNRSIAQFLGLPDESEAKNPSRDIRQRIEEAIEGIEKKILTSGEKGALMLTPCNGDSTTIKDYLDNGYLKVEIAGSYAPFFINGANQKTRSIEAARRKREKIVEAAKVKNLADSMKQQQDEK